MFVEENVASRKRGILRIKGRTSSNLVKDLKLNQ